MSLPIRAGLGLKPEHFDYIISNQPDIGFFEIHAENYMVKGGPFHHYLTQIRNNYPLSIHGVGLSIGGESPLDIEHLKRIANLISRYQPQSFSEHLAWSTHNNTFLNDLLPLPYTTETLQRVCDHVDQVQNFLNRQILLENPATYIEFNNSTTPEPEFISDIIRKTGCGLLLDINNIYVSCINHQKDPLAYLKALPLDAVGEIHLAGFTEDDSIINDRILIDSHGTPISKSVWRLYEQALKLSGACPTLIERDNNIPPFEVIQMEAEEAERLLVLCEAHSTEDFTS